MYLVLLKKRKLIQFHHENSVKFNKYSQSNKHQRVRLCDAISVLPEKKRHCQLKNHFRF